MKRYRLGTYFCVVTSLREHSSGQNARVTVLRVVAFMVSATPADNRTNIIDALERHATAAGATAASVSKPIDFRYA